jgi:predicted RNA binding protein YcfA (HicA-like mRNA interferase family)
MPSEVRFAVVRRRLESCGFVLRRIKGSHHTFTKSGHAPVIIPVHHGKVKPVYVQEVERVCREEGGTAP